MEGNQQKRLFGYERTGTFNLNSWCWEAGPRTLKYRIRCVVGKLNSDNFVMDNRAVETYFAEKYEGKTLAMSCESIAQAVLDDLCQWVLDCMVMEVGITGNPDATWLTAILGDRSLLVS